MPTYVYKFIDTDETIEVQQSFADDTLTEYTHPDSGETLPVKKVFLPVGVTFKGDGFYKTDSRSSSTASKSSTSSSNGDSTSGESTGSSSSTKDSTSKDSTPKDSSSTSKESSTASASSSSSSSTD